VRPCLDDLALLGLVTGSSAASADAEEHLAECATCRAAVAILLREGASRPAALFPPRFPPGTQIGRYEVREHLGSGGMGVVYAARDPKLDRTVALKIVRAPRLADRSLREAQAMARLSHPNVVAVHDVITHDDELVIVLELVPGSTLTQWLASPRTWHEIVGAFLQAARGLEAAHTAGLVHRDFKPANVFVRDEGGRVQVGDFGLARLVLEPGNSDPAAAQEGTPHYMAPEQKLGISDARSDQYAFAIALREALDRATDLTQLPRSVDDAVARASSQDPADRFRTMEALAATLASARTPRRRVALVVGLAIAGLVGGGYAVTRTKSEPASPPQHVVAMLPFADHTKAAELDFTHVGLPRLLGTELQRAGLRVIGTYELRDRAAVPPSNDDVVAWRELAATLDADLAVSGTLTSDGRDVVVAFTLARTSDGLPLGAWVVRGIPSRIPDLVGARAGSLVAATGQPPAAASAPRDFAVERDLSLAIEAFQQLQLQTARTLLANVLRREPQRAEALYYTALVAWWDNEAEHVVQLAGERALASGLLPEQRGVISALVALVAGDRDRAIDQLRRLDEQFPASTHVRYLLSEALFHGGFPAEGIAVYRQLADLAPRWHLALAHPLTYYAVNRDEAGMQWALARLPLLDAPSAAIWRHRYEIMRGDLRGAFRTMVGERDAARARGEPFLGELDLVFLAMALDEDATVDAATREIPVVAFALALRRGEPEPAGAAFDAMLAARATDRQYRFTLAHALPLVAVSGDAALTERALRLLDAAIGTSRPSIDEQLGRLFLRGVTASELGSSVPEVATLARAMSSRSPQPALWQRAFQLSSDGLFVVAGRVQLVRALVAAADHAGVIAQCEPILNPRYNDLVIGVAIPPCLAWTAAALESLGRRDAALAAYRRLAGIRAASDALHVRAVAGIARLVTAPSSP